MNQPIVTIGVLTYNSSKTVTETLESIKAQTYPNIILQISDDCSTDNTIEICEKWIEKNKDRFVKTKIIVPEQNTGVAGNANRNWDACETEWFKEIAGDDLLLPDCIEEYVNYVSTHPDAVFVFSKVECFGASQENLDRVSAFFDYSVFDLNIEEKLERLITKGNCIPAATTFNNMSKIRATGIRHDERIPMLEDYPKWINFLKAGVDLHFIDKPLVKYRTDDGVSTSEPSLSYRICYRTFYIYYIFPYLYQKDPNDALDRLTKYDTNLIRSYYTIRNSKPIKISNFIMSIFRRNIAYLSSNRNRK